jgi:hypothetical protein
MGSGEGLLFHMGNKRPSGFAEGRAHADESGALLDEDEYCEGCQVGHDVDPSVNSIGWLSVKT